MIRASSAPRLLACPASAAKGAYRYDPQNDASAEGTAVHACLALHVVGSRYDSAEEAARTGADPYEVEAMAARGIKAWREIKPALGPVADTRAEAHLDGLTTRGTADVLAVGHEMTSCVIVDWKAGRVDRDYSAQLGAYALAYLDAHGMPASGEIVTAVAWLRLGRLDVERWDAPRLAGLRARIEEALAHPERAAPGEHCGYCPHQLECGARQAYLRSSALALAEPAGQELAPEALARLYPQAKALRQALDRYDDALRVAVAAAGQDGLEVSGGTLRLVERHTERIRAREAWPILARACGEEALARAVSVGKTEILRAVGDAAARGAKGKAQVQLMTELREAGAVEIQTQSRLEFSRAKGESDE